MAGRDEIETSDADIREIREEYKDAQNEKAPIREEGDIDMRFIAGDPWDPEDRTLREDANRPVITADELSQYVNQLVNDVRQNKRAIKVAPASAKASSKTAEIRQSLIRQIEYRSNAATHADPIMFENAAQRGYGYLRVKPQYADYRSFDQELRIVAIPNPNMVTEDPYALDPTGKDWKFLYFSELWSKADFRRQPWGKTAKFQSFDPHLMAQAPSWFKGERILIAERWRIVTEPRELLLVQPPVAKSRPGLPPQPPPAPQGIFRDELDLAKLPRGATIVKSRTVDYPRVKQQIVNGVEILDEKDFPGTTIPFVACYGKVLYLDAGAGPKKHLVSLIRLARSPFMLYCYYRTQQAEMAGMIPKVPVQGYKGQFAGVENDWQKAPHEPMAFLEVAIPDDWNTNWGPPPLPQRLAYDAGAHLQALELCAEGARRAIQAAIGASPLPTQAQRHNEKSGVALKQIEDTAQKGSFHFIDHFDAAKVRTGEILDELLPFFYDAARDVTVRQPDDQPVQIRINDPDATDPVHITDDLHDVTLSVGPRQISEREAASDFADTLVGSDLVKLMPQPLALKVWALAIRLKAVGPIGDEIADLLAPKNQDPQTPSPAQIQQMQTEIQTLQQQLQEASYKLETDAAKQQAQVQIKQLDNELKIKLAEMANAAKIEAARITAAKEAANAQAEAAEEQLGTGLTLEHEASEAELDRQHEAALAAQAHSHALDQAAVASAHTMDQQANQAALQPPPDEGA